MGSYSRKQGQTDTQRRAVAEALELRGRAWRALYLDDYRDAAGRRIVR